MKEQSSITEESDILHKINLSGKNIYRNSLMVILDLLFSDVGLLPQLVT